MTDQDYNRKTIYIDDARWERLDIESKRLGYNSVSTLIRVYADKIANDWIKSNTVDPQQSKGER